MPNVHAHAIRVDEGDECRGWYRFAEQQMVQVWMQGTVGVRVGLRLLPRVKGEGLTCTTVPNYTRKILHLLSLCTVKLLFGTALNWVPNRYNPDTVFLDQGDQRTGGLFHERSHVNSPRCKQQPQPCGTSTPQFYSPTATHYQNALSHTHNDIPPQPYSTTAPRPYSPKQTSYDRRCTTFA